MNNENMESAVSLRILSDKLKPIFSSLCGSEMGKTHVMTFHAIQSKAAVRNRTVSEETVSVDGWQTPFSVNGNAVHTRHISVDGDR